jgi:hypothetical protein
MSNKFTFLIFAVAFVVLLSSTALAFNWNDGGLISYYKLDESSGNILDSMYANNGTTTNVLYSAPGKINTALNFTGGSSYVTISSLRNIPNNFSTSFWINPKNISMLNGEPIISRRISGSDWQIWLTSATGNNYGNLSVLMWGLTPIETVTFAQFAPVGSWTHVVVTYNGSHVNIYKNGVLNLSNPATGNQINGAWGIKIGTDNGNVNSFNGTIDEVGIWNISMVQQNVTDLYGGGSGLPFLAPSTPSISIISEVYNNQTVETSPELFSINISGNTSTGVFYYNNVPYTDVITSITGNYTTFNKTLQIPLGIPTNASGVIYSNTSTVATASRTYVLVKSSTVNNYVYSVIDQSSTNDSSGSEIVEFVYVGGKKANLTKAITSVNYYQDNTYLNPFLLNVSKINVYLLSDGVSVGYASYEKDLYVYNSTFNSFFWNFNGQNSTTHIQEIYPLLFGICNSTPTNKFLNITFKDETTLALVNATINSMSLSYNIPGSSTTKSYSFSNLSINWEYDFCSFSNLSSMSLVGTIGYANVPSFPQRTFYMNNVYNTSSLENKTLYLLNVSSGVNFVIQSTTASSQILSGVYITVNQSIGGVSTLVLSGTTDSSGVLSLFLNPNVQYTIMASKTGYTSQTFQVIPTNQVYLLSMGSTGQVLNYTSPTQGLLWSIYPASGMINCGDTLLNYSLGIRSQTSSIYNCSFSIYWSNGTIMSSAFGCNNSAPNQGGIISTLVNCSTMGRGTVLGIYYVTLNTSNGIETVILEADARWVNIPMNYTNNIWNSMKSALQGFVNLPEWGGCPVGYSMNSSNPRDSNCYCTDASGVSCTIGLSAPIENQQSDFSRLMFFFLFFAILLAILNFFTGYDTAYPGAFIYVFTGIVLLLTLINGVAGPGFFYLAGASNANTFCPAVGATHPTCTFSQIIDNWLFPIHCLLLCLTYWLTTNRRYQS